MGRQGKWHHANPGVWVGLLVCMGPPCRTVWGAGHAGWGVDAFRGGPDVCGRQAHCLGALQQCRAHVDSPALRRAAARRHVVGRVGCHTHTCLAWCGVCVHGCLLCLSVLNEWSDPALAVVPSCTIVVVALCSGVCGCSSLAPMPCVDLFWLQAAAMLLGFYSRTQRLVCCCHTTLRRLGVPRGVACLSVCLSAV